MYSAFGVLPQVDFIQIGFKNLVLVVMKLQQQSHHGLIQFSPQVTISRKEHVLYQLLRYGTAALYGPSRLEVCRQRSGNRFQVNTEVLIEPSVLNHNQHLQKQVRRIIQPDQNSVLAMCRKDSGYIYRVKPDQRDGFFCV